MTSGTPNTLLLHRYHLGELDAERAARVREAIAHNPDVRRRYQAIVSVEAEIQTRPVPSAIAALGDRPARRWLRPLLGGVGGAAALVAVALVVVQVAVPTATTDAPSAPYIGVKGALPELEVWIGTPRGPRLLRPGEPVVVGDTVQLAVGAVDADFVTLVGVDGSGAPEIYGTVTVQGEAMQLAPFALVLEGEPGVQRFLALPHDDLLDDGQVVDLLDAAPERWRTVELRLLDEDR